VVLRRDLAIVGDLADLPEQLDRGRRACGVPDRRIGAQRVPEKDGFITTGDIVQSR